MKVAYLHSHPNGNFSAKFSGWSVLVLVLSTKKTLGERVIEQRQRKEMIMSENHFDFMLGGQLSKLFAY